MQEREVQTIELGVDVTNRRIVIFVCPHEYMKDCKKLTLRRGNVNECEVAYAAPNILDKVIEGLKSIYSPSKSNPE
jgi:hypothetical protein